MHKVLGLINVGAASPNIRVGDVKHNTEAIIKQITDIDDGMFPLDVMVFPELCMCGYTCGDLLTNGALITAATNALYTIAKHVNKQLVIVGCPIHHRGKLYNCAVAINEGKIIGIVPKTSLPNYKEFYEQRWFSSGADVNFSEIKGIPFGTDLIFECGSAIIGIEICEDLWIPIPPSSHQAISGANILCNLSASNDLVGKEEYRRNLVANQSGRCVAAYVYACALPSESTTDVVMSGHNIIAMNGKIKTESPRETESGVSLATIDVEMLLNQRISATSFGQSKSERDFRTIKFDLKHYDEGYNGVDQTPFIPKTNIKDRCNHILHIQKQALVQRLRVLPDDLPVVIGVSGGLDSTLALLVTVRAFKELGRNLSDIIGITLPGFGTSDKTYNNADRLMDELGITNKHQDITHTCTDILSDIEHKGEHDLTFENVQARYRTLVLMSHGFVIGTGDMSELALGWCTYNGDHMSMYNVNCSIPKTLVKTLVRHCLDISHNLLLKDVLEDILYTEISPELLPEVDGKIQSTEDTLGPYELHDFFLAYFQTYGFGPKKLFYYANQGQFGVKYTPEIIKKTLKTFFTRFFANQFKRSCVPDGPKVGSVSLSPRGDWRMPSDASAALWLKEIEEIDV